MSTSTATLSSASSSSSNSGDCALSKTLQSAVEQAVDRIAPAWPLDKMIAVNPLWSMRHQPYQTVAATLSAMKGIHCLWGAKEYQALYERGHISDTALATAAISEGLSGDHLTWLEQIKQLEQSPPSHAHWRNMAALVDDAMGQHAQQTIHYSTWQEAITQQISQFCAAHYQAHQQDQQSQASSGLYQHWLRNVREDSSVELTMSSPALREQLAKLPNDPRSLMTEAIAVLAIPSHTVSDYLHSLLLSINGWASYVAYLRWQQSLGQLATTSSNNDVDDGVALLAIRLAWELALYQLHLDPVPNLKNDWQSELLALPEKIDAHKQHQQCLWVWAKALEQSEQQRLQRAITDAYQQFKASPTAKVSAVPRLQAVFCIDVRSEVIRRAVESQHHGIQTLGFAGFFGLPIAYQAQQASLSRPQLPGLLAPSITVRESTSSNEPTITHIKRQAHWKRWGQSASSGFSHVESAGWLYGIKMLKQTFFPDAQESPLNALSHNTHWTLYRDDKPLSIDEQAQLCEGILSAMGITQFAETVLLVGHGSCSSNNLHAAGLDCGACGGQTGEVNVRVLAQLLNHPDVRRALADQHSIPASTKFIPALHNTTTEEITCFNSAIADTPDTVSVSEEVNQWLTQATLAAQQERAPAIFSDWESLPASSLSKKFTQQSLDWSQVRPEWGLANNNAFVIAPRAWTKQANLHGRVFLHDYQQAQDADNGVLELLMTAPMIVTHWINMQYNTSTTDNTHYGSGNKVLHNAVGGNIGVFEGNGGDLRIGLSKQSLHNGKQWMHTPQRLSVYIAATPSSIGEIVSRHEMLQQLIDNEWINVWSWQPDTGTARYFKGEWIRADK